jgi:hypothetical protein
MPVSSLLRRHKAEPVPQKTAVSSTDEASSAQAIAETGRAAPEPLSLILPAYAALGAITSISAVAWVAQDRTAERARVKRRIHVIIRDLETSAIGTQELFRRIKRNGKLFGLDGAIAAAPLKFGLHGGRVDAAAGEVYGQLANDAATMLVLATTNSFEAMAAIEDGEIDAPESLFVKLGECQDRLNALIVQRAPIFKLIESGIELAGELVDVIRQLKSHVRT